MNFLKDRVKKYQEKKLVEAKEKLKIYTTAKNQLENKLKTANENESLEIKKNIEKQKEFIKIWNINIETINKQIKKLNS